MLRASTVIVWLVASLIGTPQIVIRNSQDPDNLPLSGGGWTAPLGIPSPVSGDWDPFGDTVPADPASWTPDPSTEATAGFYYICPTCGGATDTSNTFGHPDVPRVTIPDSTTFAAGSKIVLCGTYDRSQSTPSSRWIRAAGTASSPVWLTACAAGASIVQPWVITEAAYLTIDGRDRALNFTLNGASTTCGRITIGNTAQTANTDHIVLRNTDHGGDGIAAINCGVTTADNNADADEIHHIVLYNIRSLDNSFGDVDNHAVAISSGTSYFWLLDSEIRRAGGNGIQLNGGDAELTTHHVYVGRNTFEDTVQRGIGIKQGRHYIISQNLIYNNDDEIGSDQGECAGQHYGTGEVWWIANTMHDCEGGIVIGSTTCPGTDCGSGDNVYVVGNLFYNIIQNFNAGIPAAMQLSGAAEPDHRYAVSNTVFNGDFGMFDTNNTVTRTHCIANNVFGTVSVRHIDLDGSNAAANSTLNFNLFQTVGAIQWGSSTTRDVPGMIANTTQCDNCLEGNPLFVNTSTADFRLQSGSPAKDTGQSDPCGVYATFLANYGISIAMDMNGVTRPQGAGWDMGAYEFQ